VSFSNDESGDGLAALFGGITPQGDAGPRRTAPAAPAPAPGEPAPVASEPADPVFSATPPGVAPQYPGLAPSLPVAAPTAPPAYSPPAYSPPAYPPPAAAPAAYAPPASPAYEMPAPPVYGMPTLPTQPPPSYDLPAPAVAPAAPVYDAPAVMQTPPPYDPPAPDAGSYPGLAPSAPTYPPTAQYPAGTYPPTQYPAEPASAPYEPPPAYPVAPPSAYSSPAAEVPVFAPPPAGAYDLAPPVEPNPVPPSPPVAPQHPLVRSEPAVPATVFPPGPLLPSSTAAVETPEDLERSTAGEKVGLVLAVLTGPIGLAVAIGNAVRSARRRGWLIGLVRASLVLGVLSTIAAGVAGYVLWNIRADQIQHADVAAASAEFCAAAAADPAMVAPPTLGWPAQGASIGESLDLMQAWTDRWTTLAATAPAKLSTGLELLAEKGQTIIDAVTAARVVDDAANQAQIASAEAQSGVATWYSTYCLEP
jgi:hypothetical protein